MDWQKAQSLAVEVARGAVFADEFEKGGKYALHATGRVGVVLAKAAATGGLLAVIREAPNTLKKRLDDALALLGKLRKDVRDVLNNFSDKTLIRFSSDLTDQEFFDWVNDANNEKFVRGFVNHKLTDADVQDIGGLLAELENLNDLPPQVTKWLENSESSAKFKYFRDLGIAFERKMRESLADVNSAAYKGLLSKVPDLDQRTILSQVQFCVNRSNVCNNAGEYFIADFVAVVEKVDPLTNSKYLDAVIIDTKLSVGTAFTPNQKIANDLGSMAIKSAITQLNLVKGNVPDNFAKGVSISKNGNIKKMSSDGNGNYLQVN